ncbi:palmitoyltransferase [Orbilia brochopaga]|uniref:Synaptobrevin homolog YKT6 n=1 Tax=Orbilia brochopaga TaxID=3140254 RepID=A0AAV9U3S6_9PEZI
MASSSSASTTAVYHIAIYDTSTQTPNKLAAVSNLNSFGRFTRGSVGEFMNFTASTIASRTAAGVRQSVQEQSYMVHAYTRPEGCTGIIITNAEYPTRIPHELLNRVLDEFITANPKSKWAGVQEPELSLPNLEEYLSKYQDPTQADNISKIQRELDETKIVLHKTIESVLDRGERLDTLVQRSDNLSAASKMFYTSAKKQNSCCVLM